MRERSPWVKVDDHVHLLTPAVECHAFSPSERYLAWTGAGAVHVTELDSLRTVCTLPLRGVFSLSWIGDEVLRVAREVIQHQIAVSLVLSRHGLPDGGTLGTTSTERFMVSGAPKYPHLQTSLDGRVALARVAYGRDDSFPHTWLVGAAGDDDIARLALTEPPDVPVPAEASLGPDGHIVAILQHASYVGPAAIRFTTTRGASSQTARLPPGYFRLIGWVSPTHVLILGFREEEPTTLLLVGRDGSHTDLGASPFEGLDGPFDLRPERDQILVRWSHSSGRERLRTFALRVPLDGSAPEAVPLSGWRALETARRDGGACWDRDGALLTLTQSPPGVANLARRDASGAPARRLMQFSLSGDHPYDLDLAASPRRTRFVATWMTGPAGSDSSVRRLALLTVP